ncbi:unnamed protein product [Fusarium graminearum]|uniref:Chromosome 1, complete genome n=1 Tax=Gibberella zeae (strain ATCC MYA-4620 / CBS 123657 / FGSC 9075 / NRRL 31084 / PH-1) TaxID=229533 RepID=I1S4K5_GIBZE|nr:hypothetical protein FGSG_11773 [Fusarium graminearum PH-1]ESU05686.1 hypothetical protein FGSG_11773 [Fusarium graminearum PH-1]CEF72437.1 unnamed protein product [Fusarium graminearum]CZS75700.1 unnamed protein product [Fusarium graminearum]|eukprot:XP_011316171.1 hypothetical protein FGSG_11773 [Fusarium graminearum PH-1]
MFSRFHKSFKPSHTIPSHTISRFTGYYASHTPCLSRNLNTSRNFRRLRNTQTNINEMHKWIREIRANQKEITANQKREEIWRKELLDAISRLEPKQSFFGKLFSSSIN